MYHQSLFYLVTLLSLISSVNAGNWDDFVNNLSTDLAPIIALFGETVTKQWLSESLTIWDSIIFATGPLGIITAVVSMVRVMGSPSLKAFIGRAQESPGTAELELLSCTSDTTTELWNEGGIARVFGRGCILEVVRRTGENPRIETMGESIGEHGAWKIRGKIEDIEKDASIPFKPEEQHQSFEVEITPSPNLSLNVGHQRLSNHWYLVVAAIGTFLQSGVLVFCWLSVYKYPSSFPIASKKLTTNRGQDEIHETPEWAVWLAVLGTCGLCFGMFLCAYHIEKSTAEVYYEKKSSTTPSANGDGDIYWVQMGRQTVGDQVFNAFIGKCPPGKGYVRSQKIPVDHSTMGGGKLSIALTLTLFGFAMQFVGMRYLHPSISLAQLGITLIMSALRGLIRMQRMEADQNLIPKELRKYWINGHELDYLTFLLQTGNEDDCDHSIEHFHVKFGSDHFEKSPVLPREQSQSRTSHIPSGQNLLAIRTSLVRLTPEFLPGNAAMWKTFEVRNLALSLKNTFEDMLKVLLQESPEEKGMKFMYDWQWSTTLSTLGNNRKREGIPETLAENVVVMNCSRSEPSDPPNASRDWEVDFEEIEALLGLWSWVWQRQRSGANLRALAHFCHKDDEDAWRSEFRLWVPDEPKAILSSGPKTMSKAGFHHGFQSPMTPSWPLYTVSQETPMRMCAQDIFMAFLAKALETLVADLGGSTDCHQRDLQTTVSTDQVILPSRHVYSISNTKLDSVVSIFETNKLGSRIDGTICVFAAVLAAKKIPSTKEAFSKIQKTTGTPTMYHDYGQFHTAYHALSWISEHCQKDYRIEAVINLCEFALSGIQRAQQNIAAIVYFLEPTFKVLTKFLVTKNHSTRGLEDHLVCSYAWTATRMTKWITSESPGILEYISDAEARIQQLLRHKHFELSYAGRDDRDQLFANCSVPVLRYFFGEGPNSTLQINAQDSNGRTVFSWGAQRNDEQLASWLQRQGDCDIFLPDHQGITPLMHACAHGSVEILSIFPSENKVAIQDSQKRTALHHAVMGGNTQVIEHLLSEALSPSKKSDLEVVDVNNRTPLSYAAKYGEAHHVRLLVNRGADLFHSDDEYQWSALGQAVSSNDNLIMMALQSYTEIMIRKKRGSIFEQDAWQRSNLIETELIMEAMCKKELEVGETMLKICLLVEGPYRTGVYWKLGDPYSSDMDRDLQAGFDTLMSSLREASIVKDGKRVDELISICVTHGL